jgi:hypothetical protein
LAVDDEAVEAVDDEEGFKIVGTDCVDAVVIVEVFDPEPPLVCSPF